MSLFDLFDWTKALIEKFGYFGVFLGTFLESVFPPIPSEVIMGFSGFLISEGKFNPVITIIAAIFGNFCSASLIWFLGHKYGRAFIVKYGSKIGISVDEIEKGEKLFNKYGYKIVFASQIVPLIRSWIAFPAGVLKTRYWKFILTNTAGASIWLSFLAYLGYTAGNNWNKIEDTLKPFEKGILFVFVVIFGYFCWKWYQSKRQADKR